MSHATVNLLSTIAPFSPPSLATSIPTAATSANKLAGSLLLSSINPGALYLHLTADEIHPVPGHYPPLARIHPAFADSLWATLRHLAAIILCSGNCLSPEAAARNPPHSIPATALSQIGLPLPSIVAIETLGERNPLRLDRTLGDQYFTVRTLQYAGRGAIAWLACAIERSASLGDDCAWQWAYGLSLRPPFAVDADAVQAALERELQDLRPPSSVRGRQVIHHPLNPTLATTPAAADLCRFLHDRTRGFSNASSNSNGPITPPSSPDPSPAIRDAEEDQLSDLTDLSLDSDDEAPPLLIFD
jgi:hypothetical protein